MNRAVIYARFSNGPRQTEQSIEGQVADCTSFANANNLTVVGIYADKHISGTSVEGRTEFLRMVSDAKKGMFDAVIVWKVDRFGRDRRDIAVYKHQLKAAGVSLYYAAESIPEGPEGILLESLMEGLAEYYSADLRQKVERGMKESLKKGQYPGKLPIGYKKDQNKQPIIDQENAEIVRRIFDMHCNGHSTTEISRNLTKNGIKMSEGSVYRILNNNAYTGKLSMLGVEIEVKPIISAEIFEKSSQNFKTTRNKKGTTMVNYLLSGKCRCGECGSNVIGISAHGKSGRVFAYYQCKKKCFKAKNATKFEDLILQKVISDILNDDMISQITNRIMEIQEQDLADNSNLNSYKAKLADIKKKKSNIIKAIENGLYSPEMNARMDDLNIQETDFLLKLEKEKIEKPLIPEQVIRSWLMSFRNGDILDEDFCKKLINTFVAEVVVFSDHAIVVCNVTEKSGNQCSFELSFVNQKELYSNTNQPLVILPYILLYVST